MKIPKVKVIPKSTSKKEKRVAKLFSAYIDYEYKQNKAMEKFSTKELEAELKKRKKNK